MSRGVIGGKVEAKKVAGPKNYTEEERGQLWWDARRK
jgi:hypothetical protein